MTKLIFKNKDDINDVLVVEAFWWCSSVDGVYYRESKYSGLCRVTKQYMLFDTQRI